jgi:uncharacterized protein (DUF433 family)
LDTFAGSYNSAAMIEIDWTTCPDVESVTGRCSGAWVVKGTRVMVESCILDNYAADETPRSIARMFSLPVATVRRVLHFALSAELAALIEQRRQAPAWTRADAYRRDKLARQLREIEKALKPRRAPP